MTTLMVGRSTLRLILGHPALLPRPHDTAGRDPPAQMMQCKMTDFQDFLAPSIAKNEAIVSIVLLRTGWESPGG
jgi:hypothetical protein